MPAGRKTRPNVGFSDGAIEGLMLRKRRQIRDRMSTFSPVQGFKRRQAPGDEHPFVLPPGDQRQGATRRLGDRSRRRSNNRIS